MNNKKRAVNLVLTGLLAAIIAIFTMITIPMPSGIPITLQTFAIALCGYMLGSKYGTAAVSVYVLIGAIGIPVFSSFMGGIGVLVGLTGGFIWGFFPLAFLCGLGVKFQNKFIPIAIGIAGLLLCHLIGALQFAIIAGQAYTTALLTVSVPYLLKDVISVVAAYAVATAVKVAIKKSRLEINT